MLFCVRGGAGDGGEGDGCWCVDLDEIRGEKGRERERRKGGEMSGFELNDIGGMVCVNVVKNGVVWWKDVIMGACSVFRPLDILCSD